MSQCTICGGFASTEADLCAWCDTANFSAAPERTPPQPWWVALRLPLAPKRDGLRALLPPQEETP